MRVYTTDLLCSAMRALRGGQSSLFRIGRSAPAFYSTSPSVAHTRVHTTVC